MAGLIKSYRVKCLEDPEVLVASVDRSSMPVCITLKPKELAKLLANFGSAQSDITVSSHPGSASAPRKRLRLSSYFDATKGEQGPSLRTVLDVDAREDIIAGYSHRGEHPTEGTVNLKDLKALTRPTARGPLPRQHPPPFTFLPSLWVGPSPQVMVTFCDALDADVTLYMAAPGEPLVLEPDFRAKITAYYEQRGGGDARRTDLSAELVLATVVEPPAPQEDWERRDASAAGEAQRRGSERAQPPRPQGMEAAGGPDQSEGEQVGAPSPPSQQPAWQPQLPPPGGTARTQQPAQAQGEVDPDTGRPRRTAARTGATVGGEAAYLFSPLAGDADAGRGPGRPSSGVVPDTGAKLRLPPGAPLWQRLNAYAPEAEGAAGGESFTGAVPAWAQHQPAVTEDDSAVGSDDSDDNEVVEPTPPRQPKKASRFS